jgi:hypothetical protein
MKALIRIAALTLLMFPVAIAAQDQPAQHPMAGYWEGAVAEPGAAEPVKLLVELRIQGDVVNGPVFMLGGEQYIQQGGTATVNSVTFTTPRLNLNDRNVPLTWTGQLTGNNELAFTVVSADGQDPVREFVLTKQVR